MRIISFCKYWDKLQNKEFTTFRFPRKDKDWYVGEIVQVYYKNRSKQRQALGTAEILSKEFRAMARYGDKTGYPCITNDEAIADGFPDAIDAYGNHKSGYFFMWEFLWDNYRFKRLSNEPMNKLTLVWIDKLVNT